MANDQYKTVAFMLPIKTIQRVDKIAEEFDLSRGNTLMRLVEYALITMEEPIEVSSVSPDGVRSATGTPTSVNNMLRKIL